MGGVRGGRGGGRGLRRGVAGGIARPPRWLILNFTAANTVGQDPAVTTCRRDLVQNTETVQVSRPNPHPPNVSDCGFCVCVLTFIY